MAANVWKPLDLRVKPCIFLWLQQQTCLLYRCVSQTVPLQWLSQYSAAATSRFMPRYILEGGKEKEGNDLGVLGVTLLLSWTLHVIHYPNCGATGSWHEFLGRFGVTFNVTSFCVAVSVALQRTWVQLDGCRSDKQYAAWMAPVMRNDSWPQGWKERA